MANDTTANFLFLNRGGLRFEEVALEPAVRRDASGGYQAGMGVACGDVDGDGRLDLAVTNYYGESTSLFTTSGEGCSPTIPPCPDWPAEATAWASSAASWTRTTTAGST